MTDRGLRLYERSCPVCGQADRAKVFSPAHYEEDRLDSFSFSSRKLPEYMHFRMMRCIDCEILQQRHRLMVRKKQNTESDHVVFNKSRQYRVIGSRNGLGQPRIRFPLGDGNGIHIDRLNPAEQHRIRRCHRLDQHRSEFHEKAKTPASWLKAAGVKHG